MATCPTTDELVANLEIKQALEEAWTDSASTDGANRHEEGGWIYSDVKTGAISVERAPMGTRATIDLGDPPEFEDRVVVGTFHTHPNPSSEGWETGPSQSDTDSAHFLGVPCIIRADDGIHTTGPNQRRGGLTGNSGFPD